MPQAGGAVSLTLLERAFRLRALAGCLEALLAAALQPASRPRYRFQPGADAFAFATRVLNRMAGNDLKRVLEIILRCETVPATLREFIRDHRKEVEDETAKRLSRRDA